MTGGGQSSGDEPALFGRSSELATAERALETDDRPTVVFVQGPAGIGKSALVARLLTRATAEGRTVHHADGRDVPLPMERFVSCSGTTTPPPPR